jgi:hypothetical protein
MTTTTREQEVLAAAEAQQAGRAYTGLTFPPGAGSFGGASPFSSEQIRHGSSDRPWLEPHQFVFNGQSREGRFQVHGADIIVEGYASSTTGADFDSATQRLVDTSKDFVAAGVQVGDVVIVTTQFWLSNTANFQIYKVTGVFSVTELTLSPTIASNESGTVSYIIARLAPALIYTFPNNETGAAFEEQSFALVETLTPGGVYPPSSFAGPLDNPVALPQWNEISAWGADRADGPFLGPSGSTTTALPLPHGKGGFRVVLYPDDGSGTGPDLTKPITSEQPVIDPAVDVAEQKVYIDPRGFVHLSHPPKAGGDFRPNAEAYPGVLRLYAVWYTYLTGDASQARGLYEIRPSDNYFLHPSNPGTPATVVWEDDINTGEGFWLVNPALDIFEYHALGISGEQIDESDSVLEGVVRLSDTRKIGVGNRFRVRDIMSDHLWGGWLFRDDYTFGDYGAELGPRLSQLVVGDGPHSRGDFWPQTTTASVGTGGAARATPHDTESTDLGDLMNAEVLPRLRPGDGSAPNPLSNLRFYTGGTVRLRRGVYWIEETVEVPPGVTIEGEGYDTVLQAAPALGDAPMFRFGPPTTAWGGATAFPDANTERYCAWTDSSSYDGVTLHTSAGAIANGECALCYNARYDRFAAVWIEDTTGGGDYEVFFAEIDVKGNLLTDVGGGGPAPYRISTTVKPRTAFPPSISWHPLLNTYVIVWDGEDAGATAYYVGVEFWDSRRDPTLDGRPGTRNGSATNLSLATGNVADDNWSIKVKWLWGSTTAGQERRFAVAWANDDDSGAAGGDHLELRVVNVSESVPGAGYDTLGTTLSTSLLRAGDTLHWCDVVYNGSPDQFYLVFAREDIGGGGDDAIHLATFRANATDLSTTDGVGLFSISFGLTAGRNVALITHTKSRDAYSGGQMPSEFGGVAAEIGNKGMMILWKSTTLNRLSYFHVPLGYNPNTVGIDQAAWPSPPGSQVGAHIGYSGTSWTSFADVDDYRGPAFPSYHGGRRSYATNTNWSQGLSWAGTVSLDSASSARWGLTFDGDDYIVSYVSGGDLGLATICGETGQLLTQALTETFRSAGNLTHSAVAASPYRFFGVLGLDFGSNEVVFDVLSTLRFRSKLKNLRLVGYGQDTFPSVLNSGRYPFMSESIRDRSGNRSSLISPDGFVREVLGCSEVAPNLLNAPASTFTDQDVGKRIVLDSSTNHGHPMTFRIASVNSATQAVLSPNYPAAVDAGVIANIGLVFDRRFGGLRIASNGYVTCMIGVTAKTNDGVTFSNGGGLHFMMLRNDETLLDLNNSQDGGICLRQDDVVAADVIWTGALFQVYYVVADDLGADQKRFYVERTDISPAGEVVPTLYDTPAIGGGAADTPPFARGITHLMSSLTGSALALPSTHDALDFADFKVVYNGRDVAICVFGTDYDYPTNRPFIQYVVVPPNFVGVDPLITTTGDGPYLYRRITAAAYTCSITSATGGRSVFDMGSTPILRPEHVGMRIRVDGSSGSDGDYTVTEVLSARSCEVWPQAAGGVGVANFSVPMLSSDSSLAEWKHLDLDVMDTGGSSVYTLGGGDLIWDGREFVAITHILYDASEGGIFWGGFRGEDQRTTRDLRGTGRSYDGGTVTDRSFSGFTVPTGRLNTSGVPFTYSSANWFTADGSGAGSQTTRSWGANRVSIAYNPIDRIYAIAYTGNHNNAGGADDPDTAYPQVFVEYFEENGVPLSFMKDDTTAYKGDRQVLLFAGKRTGDTTGWGADNPLIIWTGTCFALSFRAYEVDDGAGGQQSSSTYAPLHILHPKEPGIIHSTEWEYASVLGGSASQSYMNADVIFDPISGDFMMAAVTEWPYDDDAPVVVADAWNKAGRLRRLSPKHLVQIAGAGDVEIDGVVFQKTAFTVRWDMGVRQDGTTSAKLMDKENSPTIGADPWGMRRVLKSIRFKDLDQRGSLLEARTLDDRGLDDPSGFNINMNGK